MLDVTGQLRLLASGCVGMKHTPGGGPVEHGVQIGEGALRLFRALHLEQRAHSGADRRLDLAVVLALLGGLPQALPGAH